MSECKSCGEIAGTIKGLCFDCTANILEIEQGEVKVLQAKLAEAELKLGVAELRIGELELLLENPNLDNGVTQ